jgi:UDP-N-acetylmuramate dehydrogenase
MSTVWREAYLAGSVAVDAGTRTAAEGSAAELRARVQGRVATMEPMARHTTFHVGGPADLFVLPRDDDDLQRALEWLSGRGLPIKVIGNGSNLLVADRGFRGAIVRLAPRFDQIDFNTDSLIVGAGTRLGRLLEQAACGGWTGLESLVGIPGTVGGALATNAGTDTGSVGDLVREAVVFDRQGSRRTCTRDELAYRYRHSSLPESGLTVIRARLELGRAPEEEIRAKMARLRVKRASRQPLRGWSAGSVFKNPQAIAAGKLLDRAGAKGLRVGEAEVSSKHANFIVNRGRATADDIRALVEQMRALVWRHYDIDLEPEIEMVGEW